MKMKSNALFLLIVGIEIGFITSTTEGGLGAYNWLISVPNSLGYKVGNVFCHWIGKCVRPKRPQ